MSRQVIEALSGPECAGGSTFGHLREMGFRA